MPKIIVASTNPVKVNAAAQGFSSMFPQEIFEVMGLSAPSGVPDQPIGDAETLLGATNRVTTIATANDADYYVGIEGGIEEVQGEMQCFAWVVIRDKQGRVGKGRTGMFLLPPKLVALIHAGHELGTAADMLFGMHNSKQKNSTVGILTGDVIDRTAYYHHAMVLALVTFKNPHLF